MTSLYDIIGVPQNATLAEIKAAYKARAKTMHPDKGGDADAFAKLAEAYDILANEVDRKRYDETGAIHRPTPFEDEVLKALAANLAKVVNSVTESNWTPDHPADLHAMLRESLVTNRQQFEGNLSKTRRRLAILGRMLEKAKPKGEGTGNPVLTLLTGSVAQQEVTAENIEAGIKVLDAAIERVDDLKWTGGRLILPGAGLTTTSTIFGRG